MQASTNGTSPPHHSRSVLGWVAVPVLALVLLVLLLLCGVWGRWLYVAGERRYWGRVHNEHLRAAGGGGNATSSIHVEEHQGRDSSEETDESIDSDKKGLFSWN